MAIGVIATLKVLEGKEKELESAFRALAKEVRAHEPGNKLYQLCRSRDAKPSYIVMEIYENDDAIAAHRESAHFKAAGAKLGPCMAGRPDIQLFDAI